MESNKSTKKIKTWPESIAETAGLLLLVFLIRTFGFGLYQVPTGSMETTMLVGERFFADKLSYLFRKPQRLEIISMNAPEGFFKYSKNKWMNIFQNYVWGPDNWTKRIIATPGDEIRGTVEDGKPVIYLKRAGETEFSKLDEPYLNKYPLIHIYSDTPAAVRKEAEKRVHDTIESQGIPAGFVDKAMLETGIQNMMLALSLWRSYDPCAPYNEQPFYIFSADQIIRNTNGEPGLKWPGTPKDSLATSSAEKAAKAFAAGKNYWDRSDEFYIKLGENQYWAMGDNRLNSDDSRVFGPVDGSKIHGRIIFRIWSVDSNYSWWIVDLLLHPLDFLKRIRWNRFLQIVR